MPRWLKMVGLVGPVAVWASYFLLLVFTRPLSTAVWAMGLVAILVSLIAVATLIWWLGRWHDPAWDTSANQARAQLWSQRLGSGGNS